MFVFFLIICLRDASCYQQERRLWFLINVRLLFQTGLLIFPAQVRFSSLLRSRAIKQSYIWMLFYCCCETDNLLKWWTCVFACLAGITKWVVIFPFWWCSNIYSLFSYVTVDTVDVLLFLSICFLLTVNRSDMVFHFDYCLFLG